MKQSQHYYLHKRILIFIPSPYKKFEETTFSQGMKRKYTDALCALVATIPPDRTLPSTMKIMQAIETDKGYLEKSCEYENDKLTHALLNKGAIISESLVKWIIDMSASQEVFEKIIETIIMQNKELLHTNHLGATLQSTASEQGYAPCVEKIKAALLSGTQKTPLQEIKESQDNANPLKENDPLEDKSSKTSRTSDPVLPSPTPTSNRSFSNKQKIVGGLILGCIFITAASLLKYFDSHHKEKRKEEKKIFMNETYLASQWSRSY